MFAEYLLESDQPRGSTRSWATLMSLGVQTALITAAIALPMLSPQALHVPLRHHPGPIYVTPVVEPKPATAAVPNERSSGGGINLSQLAQPTRIPNGDVRVGLDDPPPATCFTNCGLGPVIAAIPGSGGPLIPIPEPRVERSRPIVISRIDAGALIQRVTPVYPPLARQTHVQGEVVLSALISRQGTIEGLQAKSGHPLLVKAAIDAVKQWRYRPYVLNGQPVEVETQITVTFKMDPWQR
jgi:protein TonB